VNDRAPNDLFKALLFWGAYSQLPGCESVKWGLIEEVVMGNVAALKNRTLLHPEARAEILRRIEALTPRSERRWGRMTPHQMVFRPSKGLCTHPRLEVSKSIPRRECDGDPIVPQGTTPHSPGVGRIEACDRLCSFRAVLDFRYRNQRVNRRVRVPMQLGSDKGSHSGRGFGPVTPRSPRIP
jgi:hypothetical protein